MPKSDIINASEPEKFPARKSVFSYIQCAIITLTKGKLHPKNFVYRDFAFKKEEAIMAWNDWMDFNRDGNVDEVERILGEEMLCSSREEHEALFGDAGDFADDSDDDDDDYDF